MNIYLKQQGSFKLWIPREPLYLHIYTLSIFHVMANLLSVTRDFKSDLVGGYLTEMKLIVKCCSFPPALILDCFPSDLQFSVCCYSVDRVRHAREKPVLRRQSWEQKPGARISMKSMKPSNEGVPGKNLRTLSHGINNLNDKKIPLSFCYSLTEFVLPWC